MLPCDAAAWVKPRLASEQLLADFTLLLVTPCRYIDGYTSGAQLSDEQRLLDAQEWTSTLTRHGMLTADSQLVFMRRCDDGQLQLAFSTQRARDRAKADFDAAMMSQLSAQQ